MAIESPCILVCSIDEASGFCIGCGRMRAEIAGWIGYTQEERRSLMAELPRRMEALSRSPAGHQTQRN